jgi:hypothetical protein
LCGGCDVVQLSPPRDRKATAVIRYRLRLFGITVAELTVESDGFEVTIEAPDVEALRWGDDAGR